MEKNNLNVQDKIIQGKDITIGYFGGSITEGYGASDESKYCFRALTTSKIRERYPNINVKEVNAGIGGTGSDLGVFRCEKDLMVTDLDLVFIEFAVNDYSKSRDNQVNNIILKSMEGIVRKILKANKYVKIIFVYTLCDEMCEIYEKGKLPESVQIHEKIASYYLIPSINVGQQLLSTIKKENEKWEDYLIDGCHPSDKGYKFYADCICDFLEGFLKENSNRIEHMLQSPIREDNLECASLLDSWLVSHDEKWIKDEATLVNRYPHMLVCNVLETELKVDFEGTAIGVYWLIAPDSGDIEWSIDGSKFIRVSSWDEFALIFTRANYYLFSYNLTKENHTLTIRVSKEKDEKSIGNWIRIGAFMIA